VETRTASPEGSDRRKALPRGDRATSVGEFPVAISRTMFLPARPSRRSAGLFFDGGPGAWVREAATIRIPPLRGVDSLQLEGTLLAGDGSPASLGLRIRAAGHARRLAIRNAGPWALSLPLSRDHADGVELSLTLLGVTRPNALAWLGRVTGLAALQPYRRQERNRRLRLLRIADGAGRTLYDFTPGDLRLDGSFVRERLAFGLNVAGFVTAHLGIGESARCMVRAADAAGLAVTPIDLRLPCKNPRHDQTLASRLRTDPEHPVTVVHVDPPASRDLEHHHGRAFRSGRYLIGYWAWELPEFPDAWLPAFGCFDEIWCPSEFARRAIAAKSPLPVLTMPHAVAFARPEDPTATLRSRLGLPLNGFLFLVLYDLNSYSARKNPQAAIEAFRMSGLADRGAGLVVKVHSAEGNPDELEQLRDRLTTLPASHLIARALDRTDLTALQAACDCYVSLHRAEGFGLAVAEAMYLGKPVITTDWSATTEFADASTALPVPAVEVELTEDHGPYRRGQRWAEPDLAAAARQMCRVVEDHALREQIGAAARRRIEERFSPLAVGTLYRRRLETLALQEKIPWKAR